MQTTTIRPNDLRDLRLLYPYFNDRPRLKGPHADYFRSQDYLDQLTELGKDPTAMAKLSIHLLEHIALCPREGSTLSDFLKVHSDAETVFVCLRLSGVSNMLGVFVLPVTSPALPLLVAAIEKNLASKMFKAAQMYRRLHGNNHARYRRIEAAARTASDKARQQVEATSPEFDSYATPEARRERSQRVRDAAVEAFNSYWEAGHEKLQARIRSVSQRSYSEAFRGGYMDILIAFTSRYICPVHTAESCVA